MLSRFTDLYLSALKSWHNNLCLSGVHKQRPPQHFFRKTLASSLLLQCILHHSVLDLIFIVNKRSDIFFLNMILSFSYEWTFLMNTCHFSLSLSDFLDANNYRLFLLLASDYTYSPYNTYWFLVKMAFFQKVRCVFQISKSPKKYIPKNYPELEI